MIDNLKVLKNHTFIDLFNEDSIIVDLGANIAEFSKLFSEKYPYSKIILVEANPNLVKDIELNLKNKKNIEIINAAIGNDSKEYIEFYLSSESECSSLNKKFRDKFGINKEQSEIEVKMITLNDLFNIFNLKRIDLLKMDVEGAEWDILENFSKENYERIEQISVEFHDFVDPSLRKRTKKCIKRLKDLGYFLIHKKGKFIYGSPYSDCLFFKNEYPLLIYLEYLSHNFKTLLDLKLSGLRAFNSKNY